ncbi:NYN domain-containing protein [Candidatus Peregrinibacteria bacterium]|jgi:uncharacterized LabA/DUF88 family protein|nr:NYN domain-containing protein [Candidatus Peregrinibacteria bacterium]MBT4055727.1 NYN domain-containing protein [Candidatus Peregrinibacteria bacterium]
MKNYAFIDSQNLHIEIKKLGWEIDYRKFRVFLKDKYKISKAFTFIGYDQNNQKLYNSLEKKGYKLIFKPILKDKTGKIKGNCDAELVLHTMIEFDNFNKAIIISGDGDFYCLIKYLAKNNKLLKIGIPNKKRYSSLLKEFVNNHLYINKLRKIIKLNKKERHCDRDQPLP